MREIASTMNDELADQSMLIDDLDEHVDRTAGSLQKAMKRMNHFIKQNEGTTQRERYFYGVLGHIGRAQC
jgi:syntaxin 6